MKKYNNGITLIGLVITIVVLLILAGIAIATLTGENGVLTKTQKADITTKLKEVEEIAKISWMSRTIDETTIGQKATFAGVISDLKEAGYKIENKVSSNSEVEGITLSSNEISMNKNDTKTLSYTLFYKGETARYFVEIENNYYEISQKNGKIVVDTEITNFEKIGEDSKITIQASNNDLLEIEEPEKGQILLKSENETGETTITIKEEKSNIEAKCDITIVSQGNADTVTMNMYGKYVTNYDNSGHWQIFFTDLENIYLIHDDVISDPIYKDYSLSSVVESGNYAQGTTMLSDETRFPGYEWNYSTKLKNSSYTKNNHQAYLFMMDSGNVWNNQYRTEYMEYIIGSPTPEMVQQALMSISRSTSFRGGNIEGYWWQSQSYSGGFKKPIDNGKKYWLSGPNTGGDDRGARVCSIRPGAACYNWEEYKTECGFRPVIKLKSNITLKTTDNGETYQIE